MFLINRIINYENLDRDKHDNITGELVAWSLEDMARIKQIAEDVKIS